MSFHTSLRFYRPTEPPIVTGADLARFVDRLRETGTLQDTGWQSLQVKFGERIDADDAEALWSEPIAPQLSTFRSVSWDIDIRAGGIQQILEHLAGDQRIIYRALVSLGSLQEVVVAPITRKHSEDNEIDFLPHELGIELGLVEAALMGHDQISAVGWMSVDIAGPGYLFPWTFRDVVRRLESAPLIRKITEACRDTWPLEDGGVVDAEVVTSRKNCGGVWPDEDYDRPWDWYWGVLEG